MMQIGQSISTGSLLPPLAAHAALTAGSRHPHCLHRPHCSPPLKALTAALLLMSHALLPSHTAPNTAFVHLPHALLHLTLSGLTSLTSPRTHCRIFIKLPYRRTAGKNHEDQMLNFINRQFTWHQFWDELELLQKALHSGTTLIAHTVLIAHLPSLLPCC